MIWPIIPVSLAISFGFLGTIIYRLTLEEHQKRWIKNIFKMNVSPELVDSLLINPVQLNLEGEKRELTIIFTDLKAFGHFAIVRTKRVNRIFKGLFSGDD